jgi:hypothetical protein
MSDAPLLVDREVIVLTKNGVWLADGEEISHEPTRKLFARSLQKTESGYFLKIGRESKFIQVEDTAYFVVHLEGSSGDGYELSLSDGTREVLDSSTIRYKPGRLTCKIKGGAEEAKFLHPTYNEILHDLQEDGRSYFLRFGKPSVRVELCLKVDVV